MKKEITKIINENKDLFGNNPIIEKINIGFTNTIYKINNKYILKLCTRKENESFFQNEINFYLSNENNLNIPVLYKYSTNKNSYMYEILEKLEGEPLYSV